MRRKALCLAIVAAWAVCVGVSNLRAQQKEIAVTIDDVPLNGPRVGFERLLKMTNKILGGIKKYRIPAVGFVNESLLYVPGDTDVTIDILKYWVDSGVELGNHTYSHLGFKTTPLAEYEDDFVRGDTVTRLLMKQKGQKPRYFRHPFLQTGPTPELDAAFESFIAERGYRSAPVTIDTMDWMFLAAYSAARESGDNEMRKRVSEEYLKFVGLKLDAAEKAADELFGRPVKHILLLHANELNADNMEALGGMLLGREYSFVTLEQALKDPIYLAPDKYLATSDWLSRWAYSKDKKLYSPAPPEFIQKAYADAQK